MPFFAPETPRGLNLGWVCVPPVSLNAPQVAMVGCCLNMVEVVWAHRPFLEAHVKLRRSRYQVLGPQPRGRFELRGLGVY